MKKMAPKKQKMVEGAYRYLEYNGPSTGKQICDAMNSKTNYAGISYITNQISMVMRFSNLFYKAGSQQTASASGSKYDMIVWDIVPLDVVAKGYDNKIKHRLIPISSQPRFVQKHINAYIGGAE